MEGSIGLIPYGLIIVSGITFVFGGLARHLKGNWRYKRFLMLSKALLFTGLINVVLFFAIGRIQGKITKMNGVVLINKIELYKKDNGTYPYSLEALKPKYLTKLPKAWVGILPKDFIYDYSEQDDHSFMGFKPINQAGICNFWIGYYQYLGVEYFYNSKEKTWQVDD